MSESLWQGHFSHEFECTVSKVQAFCGQHFYSMFGFRRTYYSLSACQLSKSFNIIRGKNMQVLRILYHSNLEENSKKYHHYLFSSPLMTCVCFLK